MTYKDTNLSRGTAHLMARGPWKPETAVKDLNACNDAPVARAKLVGIAKRIKAFRAARSDMLGGVLLNEPAWDLLLTLYIADGEQYRLKVTAACNQSNVPETTALRWLNALSEAGLVWQYSNPTDARSRYVTLSEDGLTIMDRLMTQAWNSFAHV